VIHVRYGSTNMNAEREQTDESSAQLPTEAAEEEIIKAGQLDDHQEDPPFAIATVIPVGSMTVIDDAEAVHESMSMAATIHILEGTDLTVITNDIATDESHTSLSGPQRSSAFTQHTSSLSSNGTDEVFSRQEFRQATHEVVEIDAAQDSGTIRDAGGLSPHEDEQDRKLNRMQKYCKIYMAIALFMFIAGTVGIVIVGIKLGRYQSTPLVPAPTLMVPVYPTSAPIQVSPSALNPSTSTSPSLMPSCAGLYSKISSVTVTQSGSNFFTMSDEGDVIVVANFDFQQSLSFLETFNLQQNGSSAIRTVSVEGYSLGDMRISGDGSTLVLGVNNYPQSSSNEVGGALLLLASQDLGNGTVNWTIRHQLFTAGGSQGAVVHVATSEDGRTVAFLADGGDGGYYIEVYNANFETASDLKQLGQRLIMETITFDINTVVELSGSGSKLFVATSDGKVTAFDFVDGNWVQLGSAMLYQGISPQVHPSHDGTILALSSGFDFPISVFELEESHNATVVAWDELGTLDITTSSVGQHAAISADGRNVVVTETLENEQTVARLFQRSGSVLTQVQDLTLPNGIFRGISLDVGGEQLVVAVDDTVSRYRKECSSGD
jgi:hypothetical protein